jgi:glyoxylase-like metal-dependent hydrolase (beta-lactamase superfamily II)
MIPSRLLDRRTFVVDVGRGAFAVAVVGIAGCATGPSGTQRPSEPVSSATPGGPTSPAASGDTSALPSVRGVLEWSRVNLGFVSAYVLVRGGEAAIVDTGVAGSADAIEESLGAVGLGWPAVAHLILTHNHSDHAGSAAAILERAPDAFGYAGAEDIGPIVVPRPLIPVQDGDRVFDLQIVTAPGHTAGSICILDPAGSILVAGDALRTEGGRPALPSAQFTDDMDEAIASVAKLGALTFETLLVGHGDPLEGGASAAVAALGEQP